MSLNFVDNDLLKEADDYIRDHRIIELFEVNTYIFTFYIKYPYNYIFKGSSYVPCI